MASADEAMGGESSSDPLSPDDEGHNQTSEVDDGGEVDEDEDEDDNENSSSLSSEDSFESDFESESFTDVTPLHSISNSPLPTQPISAMASKIRDSLGHTDEENTEENSSASSSDEDDSRERGDGRSSGRASGDPRSSSKGSGRVSTRRATVKRAPNRAAVLQQNGTGSVEPVQIKAPGGTAEVGHLAEAIQKLGLRNSSSNNNNTPTGVRSRRQREQELRLEAENEQLLKRIIAQQSRVAELVSVGPGTLTRAHHVAPSAINRKRQQKYIHAQNLALHKRIEAARNGPVGGVSAASGITAALRAGSSRKPPRMPPLGLAQMPSRQRQDNR